jgi:uncharacterized protein
MDYDVVIGRSESEKKDFGKRGLVFIGKQFVKMGQDVSMSNKVYLDVAKTHVLLVSGKRGSGKCLHEDSLITLGDGSVKPIKELENNKDFILSLDGKLKINKCEKSEFFKRNVEKLVKLKLRSGKEIKLTPEHPLLTIKGWKSVEDLSLKSRIAVPRSINCFGNSKLEDFKVKLLAYLIAEGHTKSGWVLFSNSDENLINEVKKCVKEFNENLKFEEHGKSGCYRIANKNNRYNFKKNPVKEWLKELNAYGYLAIEKEIPEIVFKLRKEKLALFLNRLFSCDGSIYYNKSRNGWEIDYSSSSKKLIEGVQHLLLRFGVLSKLRQKKINYKDQIRISYELVIGSENIKKYIEQIGFFSKKQELQEKCLDEIGCIIRNPNVDTIPKEIWDTYRPSNWAKIGRACGYAFPKAMGERIRYAPSRQTLLKIAEVDNHSSLKLIAESDIFWDEIVSMETLDGDFEVYDLSVPKFHNFVANDIIVHNSYTLSVLTEGVADLDDDIKENLSILIFDTMGIFWSMKYPNEKQRDLLDQWDLKPKGVDVKVFTPKGKFSYYKDKGIDTDFSFTLKTSVLDAFDWCNVFDIKITDPIGVLIESTLAELEDKEYDIKDIVESIKKNKNTDNPTKNATMNRFIAAKEWGLFSKEGSDISDLLKGGQTSILDISCYNETSIKALVVGLLSKLILEYRIDARKMEERSSIEEGQHYFEFKEEKREMPLVWMIVDEAHNFLPREGKTAATDSMIHLLREGRQPGISLVLATQQPGQIHKDVMTQSDIVISHRVTARFDIEALGSIMQTYLTTSLLEYFNNLPREKGSALVLDDNSERIFPLAVRPKFSWHGGDTPSAVKKSKKLNIEI